jgi:hypothetical protein
VNLLPIELAGELVAVRELTRDDCAFVLSSWINSERKTTRMLHARWIAWRKPCVEHHVAHSRVIVACSPDVPGTIYGWLCASAPGVVEFVYVLPAARGNGLARAMHTWLHGKECAA